MDKVNIKNRFTEIYEAESDPLFRFCLIKVSNREQALDIVQDVFLRFWQAMSKDQEIEYPRVFLYTIARNRIIDWYRKKKSISLESLADPETEEPYENPDNIDLNNSKLDGEGRFLLMKIGELSSGNRDAVYLRFVEGLSPGEIGKILGISANAVSVRINRGIEELRRIAGYDIEIGK